jgi:type II secretory pathway component GspD/PulD (secretin)
VRLNALVQDGKGTILANPRSVAMSGQESIIQIRKTLNYFFNEGFDVSGRPIVKKSDISAETQGKITPTLLADGRIHMAVNVMVGSFTFTPDAGLPEQINRESTTTVRVHEEETLVIGGLRQQEMSETEVKVPFLGDLPFLGTLFRKKEKETRSSVLTLFITPHILREGEQTPPWPQVDLENGKRITVDPNDSALPE